MTDALTLAMANAERGRMACKSATPSILNTNGAFAVPWNLASPGPALEELGHYHGHVFTCVSAIARRVAGQAVHVGYVKGNRRLPRKMFDTTWLKSHQDPITALDSHPFLDVLDSPNPIHLRWSLMFSTAASLKLTGRAYWWLTKQDGKHAIWPLPASWMTPLDRMHNRWQVRPFDAGIPTFELDGKDICSFSMPDPGSPFNSVSPTRAQGKAITADESLQTSQARMLHNGINAQVAVIIGDQTNPDDHSARPFLEEHQKNTILDSLRKLYGRPEQYGSAIILDGLIRDIKQLSINPREMDFLNSGKMTKSRIYAAYGVNEIVVGENQNANRAVAVTAEDLFCRNVINPLCELLSQAMTRWVAPRFATDGSPLSIWVEPARANDPDLTAREWDSGLKWGKVTTNEYRTRILGLPPVPGGDIFLVPTNCVAVPVDGIPDTIPDDEPGNGDGDLPDDADEDTGVDD